MDKTSFKVYKLACEYRFLPSLLFYDSVHKMGDKLFREYKHWSKESSKVVLSDFSKRAAVSLEHNRLAVQIDMPENADALIGRFTRAWKEYYSEVKPSVFRRLGYRMQGILPVEMKFEELVSITYPKLFNASPSLGKIIGTNTKDYQHHVITTHSDKTVTQMICGVIRKSEAEKLFKPVALVLDGAEKPFEITFPEVGFWIDCDLFLDEPPVETQKTFCETSSARMTAFTHELVNYLLEP